MRFLRLRPLPILSASVLCLLAAASGASAQAPCRGDIDDDGAVGPGDLVVAEIIAFMDVGDLDPGTAMRADANADGRFSAADVTAIVERQGFMCPPGPSRTPTGTS